MQGDDVPGNPKLSSVVGRFVGLVCLAAVGFVVLAIPAILFALAAHYLEGFSVSVLIIQILLWIHYVLLVIDTSMFAAYVLIAIYDAATELIRYVKGRDFERRSREHIRRRVCRSLRRAAIS